VKLRVIKIGSDMFDALHAYGLGIVVAHASGTPVDLHDEGYAYEISVSTPPASASMGDILADVLALPELGDILTHDGHGACPKTTLALANLDGLLAAAYTSPGIRVVSLADLAIKQSLYPSSMEHALTKLHAASARWTSTTARRSRRRTGQIEEMLREYDSDRPAIPTPVALAVGAAPGVPMGIDPSFGYASRRPRSDGLISHKEIVTVRGTHYAVALATVGAARFLRAQHVAGGLINLYIPLADRAMVDSDTTFPVLPPTMHTARQAIAARWLAYARQDTSCDARWNGLAYQVVQPQGVQAPISRGRGYVDLSWLSTINMQGARREETLVNHWRALLAMDAGHRPYDVDNLVDCLLERRAVLWMAHLRDVTLRHDADGNASAYTPTSVKGINAVMIGSETIPLSDILSRPYGTLRFGRSLRHLRVHKPSALHDVVDDLDSAGTRERLIRTLARAVQECAIASATSPFIIVPSDADLAHLLDDIDRYGVREIASVLIILSALRYPRTVDAQGAKDGKTDSGLQSWTATEAEDSSNERQVTAKECTGEYGE